MDDNSKRDLFARSAIVGIVANPNSGCNTTYDLAYYAYDIAEAMMKESEKRTTKYNKELNVSCI